MFGLLEMAPPQPHRHPVPVSKDKKEQTGGREVSVIPCLSGNKSPVALYAGTTFLSQVMPLWDIHHL